MLRKLLVLSVVLLIASTLWAEGLIFGGGANAGAAFSSASFSPAYVDLSSKTGFVVGGFGEASLDVAPMVLGVRLGANFEMRGYKIDDTMVLFGMPMQVTVSETDNYLTIPLRLSAGVDLPLLVPFVAVEPQLGILLSAKGSSNSTGVETVTDQDHMDDYNKVDFGLGFGGGADLKLGDMRVGLYGKYILGLTNIAKDSETKVKNTSFQILATVSFR